MAAEDYLPDEFSEEDVDDFLTVSCKYCHKRGLVWRTISGSYRLVDSDTGSHHTCKQYETKKVRSRNT